MALKKRREYVVRHFFEYEDEHFEGPQLLVRLIDKKGTVLVATDHPYGYLSDEIIGYLMAVRDLTGTKPVITHIHQTIEQGYID